jgi:5-methylcytosine-specific restriction enzyme A
MSHLFCKIGWMNYYAGVHAADKILGGGKYVKKHSRGVEVCNFVEYGDGKIYGAVNTENKKGVHEINIDRLGASGRDSIICDVYFFSTPKGGGQRVVGHYKRATVYREYQKIPKSALVHKANGITGYNISCDVNDSYLIPLRERLENPIRVLSGKGWPGTTQIWYAEKPENKAFVDQLLKRFSINSSISDPQYLPPLTSDETIFGLEGRRTTVQLTIIERDRSLRKKKLQSAKKLDCEICKFNFESFYGIHGRGYAEVHHIVPLSSRSEQKTKLDQLAIICANCHRMLHTTMKNSTLKQEPQIGQLVEFIENAKHA